MQEPQGVIPSHEAVLAQLAGTCLAPAILPLNDFRFLAQGRATFLASSLTRRGIEEGKNVHLDGSKTQNDEADSLSLPVLAWTVDRAAIDLKRAGRKSVERSSAVALTWWLSDPSGRLLDTQSCSKNSTDVLERRVAKALADERYPETNPDLPLASRWRQIVEPVVLTGATAIGTYLLFNLRSRRADN